MAAFPAPCTSTATRSELSCTTSRRSERHSSSPRAERARLPRRLLSDAHDSRNGKSQRRIVLDVQTVRELNLPQARQVVGPHPFEPAFQRRRHVSSFCVFSFSFALRRRRRRVGASDTLDGSTHISETVVRKDGVPRRFFQIFVCAYK